MNNEQARGYINRRYIDLTEDNPDWPRDKKVNMIIDELHYEQGFVVQTPLTGHPLKSIVETPTGIHFNVTGLVQ